jgi:hypothetical protein
VAETRVDPAAPPAPDPPQLTADLDRLRSMVEHEDVEGARAFVKELEQRWPDSESARHWARVLTPPVARRRPGVAGRSLERERKWLREHGREYPGCWLAVLEDRLLAADSNLGAVLAALRQIPGAEQALLHLQPGKAEWA